MSAQQYPEYPEYPESKEPVTPPREVRRLDGPPPLRRQLARIFFGNIPNGFVQDTRMFAPLPDSPRNVSRQSFPAFPTHSGNTPE